MKRLLVLAAVALVYLAGSAQAQLLKIHTGDSGRHRSKSGNDSPPLGPWYNYWPLEAHFQVPAMPEYPYYSAPQTPPIVPPAPYTPKGQGTGQVPPAGKQVPAQGGPGVMGYPYYPVHQAWNYQPYLYQPYVYQPYLYQPYAYPNYGYQPVQPTLASYPRP